MFEVASSPISTMSVHTLSAPVLRASLGQIVDAPGFAAANPHLSAQQTAGIRHNNWPACPVFTPYAITHHGYSQSKIQLFAIPIQTAC